MSIIETVLHANLGDMFQLGKQTLVVGCPKCLSLDTEILWKTKYSERFRSVKLRDIIGKEGYVKSLDRGKITVTKAKIISSKPKKLYRVTLKSGRVVKASLDHKFFKVVHKIGVPKIYETFGVFMMEEKLENLKIGDKLIVSE